ncbi:hypothetical protein [Mesorhizobium sp.]|nr:hypothetical protein [Mesorhizobium sp.]
MTPSRCDEDTPDHKEEAYKYKYCHPAQESETCVVCVKPGKI